MLSCRLILLLFLKKHSRDDVVQLIRVGLWDPLVRKVYDSFSPRNFTALHRCYFLVIICLKRMNKGANKVQYTSELENVCPLIVCFFLNLSGWEVWSSFRFRHELTELQILILGQKNAWRLDTSVYDFALVEVSKAVEQLRRHLEHFVLGNTLLLFPLLLNLLEQVTALTQFHHNAHLRLHSAALSDYKVVLNLDDVRMINRFHQPHFSLKDILIRIIDD